MLFRSCPQAGGPAAATGHVLGIGHGNSIEGMLKRLETMFLQAADFPIDAIRSQIAEGIDIIIHLGRLADGSRKVLEIAEICGIRDGVIKTKSLFKDRSGQGLEKISDGITNREKFRYNGFYFLQLYRYYFRHI